VHSLVVHGEPGLDEFSPLGPTTVIELKGGAMTRWVFDPAEVGITGIRAADLAGGEPKENAQTVERVLLGKGPAGAEAAVVLNAGAALYVGGRASSVVDGVEKARAALKAGAGWDALGRLRAASASRR
jgi:anthranilate phosphoribosyltransferase